MAKGWRLANHWAALGNGIVYILVYTGQVSQRDKTVTKDRCMGSGGIVRTGKQHLPVVQYFNKLCLAAPFGRSLW